MPGTHIDPSSLRARLRAAVLPYHDRLEAGLSPGWPSGEQDYLRFLSTWWGVVAPAERLLDHSPLARLAAFEWPKRRRASLVARDLAALTGRDDLASGLPVCSKLPPADNTGSAFGLAYVLEGSTLGGQTLLPFVRQKLGPAAPVSFLSARSGDGGRLWQAFVTLLETADCDGERAVGAAIETFDAVSHWWARPA